jgi:hypothetical protein
MNIRSRIDSMSVELWKSIFDWATIVFVAFTVFSGAGALITGDVISKRQESRSRQFERELTDAKGALATQEERAAKAERELLEEREHTANRDISPEDQSAISEKLKAFAGQHPEIELFPVTFEGRWIADQINGILLNAKWRIPPMAVKMLSKPPDPIVQGVLVRSTGDTKSKDAAKALLGLLGTTVASRVFDPMPLPDSAHPRVWILVGDKPTPLRSWVKVNQ